VTRTPTAVDRAAAVRAALRTLVARNGFHGASMSAVAAEAGVGTGTAYVHYASKDELVLATYLEVKRELGEAAVVDVDPDAPAAQRFRQLWLGIVRHLRADPDRARFLLQVDSSPFARTAHQMALAAGGALRPRDGPCGAPRSQRSPARCRRPRPPRRRLLARHQPPPWNDPEPVARS